MSNPALRQEPRYEPAVVIPIKQEHSLLEWLESNNRMIPRESLETDSDSDNEDIEVQDLMSDDSYSSGEEEEMSDIEE